MVKKYDKNILTNNIEFLVKRDGLKIGEIENKCGVSAGYFSRLRNNENNNTAPSLEVLISLSNLFDRSLTSLLFCDYSSLSETELFIVTFLEYITNKTNHGDVDWEKYKRSFIFLPDVVCSGTVSMINDCYDALGNKDYCYYSFFSDSFKDVADDFYCMKKDGHNLILVPVSENKKKEIELELYLFDDNGEAKKVCNCDDKSLDIFNNLLFELLEAAKKSSSQIKIDKDVKEGLESLMKLK